MTSQGKETSDGDAASPDGCKSPQPALEGGSEPGASAAGVLESLPNVSVSNHPVLLHKVTKLRNKETSNKQFRELMKEITSYLGYEATEDLKTRPIDIETPVCKVTGHKLSSKVALVPILRAGLGMVEAMLDIIPQADVHHIGMYRNKDSSLPIMYYNKLPGDPKSDLAIVLEPLIATSGTISAVLDILEAWGVKNIKVICIVASKPGLERLCKVHPNITIKCAVVDEKLTERGVVVPGLGDVGDRQFQGDDDEVRCKPKRPRTLQWNN